MHNPTINNYCLLNPDTLGCFHVRGLLSHLRQVPDHPRTLQTGLWLCTRSNPDPLDAATQLISYDNNTLQDSVFIPGLPVKVIVHGYGGQFKSPNIIAAKNAILKAVRLYPIYDTASKVKQVKLSQ
jgi:hypothetical protein